MKGTKPEAQQLMPTEHDCFSIIYRHGRVMHDKSVRLFGLSGHQVGYMRIIHDNPGISQECLAKTVKIDKGAIAKAVKDLVDKGYLTKERNTEDKRAYCLYLTDKANEICVEGERQHKRIEEKLSEGMTKEERETFKVLLGKITRNMEKMIEEETNEDIDEIL